MAVLVNRAYIEAGRRTAAVMEKRVRQRFADAYGEAEGNSIVNAMINRMQQNIRSDSADPNEILIQQPPAP